ncbi:MAG: Co2+/Mg2+ efflux protein ApaG [Hyphomicrobiaceae bacterium]|nr:MAG: Co2+/Mg2+ efflux protein ApaG [Hyphomicrobiaceae bacterium]
MYSATTKGIKVMVVPQYDEERSRRDAGEYFWLYTIEIRNEGAVTAELKSRYWRITDANGKVQEVHGKGVVGVEPVIHPGQAFRYTSGVPLQTATGFMGGHYNMLLESGEAIEVEIPAFSLDSPDTQKSVN